MENNMELKPYRVWVELGEYQGSSWCSSTDKQFETIVNAWYPQKAVEIAEAQYGGPNRCRVNYRGPA
jgi:hypothetical protein